MEINAADRKLIEDHLKGLSPEKLWESLNKVAAYIIENHKSGK